MQELIARTCKEPFKIKNLSLDERERLVGAFAWLLEEDKKQNPALYRASKTKSSGLGNVL